MIVYIYRQEYSDGLLHDNQLLSQYTEESAISFAKRAHIERRLSASVDRINTDTMERETIATFDKKDLPPEARKAIHCANCGCIIKHGEEVIRMRYPDVDWDGDDIVTDKRVCSEDCAFEMCRNNLDVLKPSDADYKYIPWYDLEE